MVPTQPKPSAVRGTSAAVFLACLLAVTGLGSLVAAVAQPGSAAQLFPSNCSYQPISTAWLSQEESTWAMAKAVPLATAAVLSTASYGNPESSGSSLAAIQADLAMLRAAGAQVIRIDLNYQPWLEHDTSLILELSSVIHTIRTDGLQLMIADSASETYRHSPLPWAAFEAAWVSRVGNLAALFHPDYYIVVKEPGWYYPMIQGFPVDPTIESVASWTSLTQTLVETVRAASALTEVGVAVAASALYVGHPSGAFSYLEAMRQLPGLDFLGFDVYGVCDLENTVTFLHDQGSGGKQVWLPEAWSIAGSEVFDPTRSAIDVQWARALYDFLDYVGARGVGIFYTDALASYSPPPSGSSALVSYYSNRTPVFYALQNLTRMRSVLGFPVGVGANPAGCQGPSVNGTTPPTGSSVPLPVGEFSLNAASCGGLAFQVWTTAGAVNVSNPSSSSPTLSVRGPGNVTAVYTITPSVGVAVVLAPVSCGSSAPTIGGSTVPGGSSIALDTGDYPVTVATCEGEAGALLLSEGNLSVNGGVLTVRGPGVLEVVFLPPNPGPNVISLPQGDGDAVVAFAVGSFIAVLAVSVLDHRKRNRSRKVPAGGRPSAPTTVLEQAARRWASAAFAAQAVAAALFGLLTLALASTAYIVGGTPGTFLLFAIVAIDLLLASLLVLAWTRSVGPIRRGDFDSVLRPTRWLCVVGMTAGLFVTGFLYGQTYRTARRALNREPRENLPLS